MQDHSQGIQTQTFRFEAGQKYKLTQQKSEEIDSLDERYLNYHYVIAISTGEFSVCDCWIVDEDGQAHPELSPIPIRAESIGCEE